VGGGWHPTRQSTQDRSFRRRALLQTALELTSALTATNNATLKDRGPREGLLQPVPIVHRCVCSLFHPPVRPKLQRAGAYHTFLSLTDRQTDITTKFHTAPFAYIGGSKQKNNCKINWFCYSLESTKKRNSNRENPVHLWEDVPSSDTLYSHHHSSDAVFWTGRTKQVKYMHFNIEPRFPENVPSHRKWSC